MEKSLKISPIYRSIFELQFVYSSCSFKKKKRKTADARGIQKSIYRNKIKNNVIVAPFLH